MGIKLYNIVLKSAAELLKGKGGASNSDAGGGPESKAKKAASARANAELEKEAANSFKSDDEVEQEEEEKDEEKEDAYGKSVKLLKPSQVLSKALEGTIDIDDDGIMLAMSRRI
jgi:hypothetical protein